MAFRAMILKVKLRPGIGARTLIAAREGFAEVKRDMVAVTATAT
jgi:hypothetical protein